MRIGKPFWAAVDQNGKVVHDWESPIIGDNADAVARDLNSWRQIQRNRKYPDNLIGVTIQQVILTPFTKQ